MQNYKLETPEGMVNYYEEGDSSNPTLVCLHGLAANGFYSFGELVPHLTKNFHLIILDSPGHGKTSSFQKESDYLFSRLATWIYRVVEEIVQGPFYLAGHSWGADVALHFTRFYPHKVLGLILLDGAFTFPQNQPEMTFDYVYSGWNDYMEQSVFEDAAEIFQEYRLYTKRWNSSKEQYALSLFNKRHDGKFELSVSKFTVFAVINAFFKEPFAEAYPAIKRPLFLIHAGHPKNLSKARAKGIAQLKTNSEAVTVKAVADSSHMLQWDEPEEIGFLISTWVTRQLKQL